MIKKNAIKLKWAISTVICDSCHYEWVAVRKIRTKNNILECPKCHKIGAKEKYELYRGGKK